MAYKNMPSNIKNIEHIMSKGIPTGPIWNTFLFIISDLNLASFRATFYKQFPIRGDVLSSCLK